MQVHAHTKMTAKIQNWQTRRRLIDLYPLLRNYDVWGVIVDINWNTK